MAGTVTPNMITISLCEDTTGWTNIGAGTQALNDITIFDARQGSRCIGDYKASVGTKGARWDFGLGTEVDFSTTTNNCVVFWFAFSKPSYGTGTMTIKMTDGSGNFSVWNLFTQSTLPSASWTAYLVKPTSTPDSISGSLNLSAVRYVEWYCDSVYAKTYVYWDAVRYGTGLTITAGTSVAPATFDDFVTSEATNAYGIINKYKGIYYVQGQLNIGTTSAIATYFKDISKTIVFLDGKVTEGFYKIKSYGNTVLDTEIYFGTKSGTSGITGCTFQRESLSQTADFSIDLSATDKTKIGVYGTNIIGASSVTLPSYDASYLREMLNSSIVSSGQVIVNNCPIENCNFIGTKATTASLLWNESINITNCNFIANIIGSAIEMSSNAGTPYAYNALLFSANTGYDVNNTSGYAIEINKNSGSNPTTSTGSAVTFLGVSVDTSITVKSTTGTVIEGARVLVWVTDNTNYFYQATPTSITGSGITATVTHIAHGMITGDNVLIQGVTNDDRYNGAFEVTVTSVDTYEYTTESTIVQDTANGTILATFLVINELSAVSTGIASDTRSWDSAQLIAGWVRKSTSTPFYKEGTISGTISITAGFSATVQLVSDE